MTREEWEQVLFEHVSDEVAQDMLNEYVLELEDEVSENQWAREFLNRMGRKCGTKDCPSLVAYVNQLEESNAKLKELVRNIYANLLWLKDALTTFDHKPTLSECAAGFVAIGLLGTINRGMRELGVECE